MPGDKMEKAMKALQESIEAMNAKMDTNLEVINKRMDSNYDLINRKMEEKQEEHINYREQFQQSLNALKLMNNDLTNKLLELKTKDDEERKALYDASIEFNSFQQEQEKLKKKAKELGVELKQEREQAEAVFNLEEQALNTKFEQEDKELSNITKGITDDLPLYLQNFKGELINEVQTLIAQQEQPTQDKTAINEKQKEKLLLTKIRKHSPLIIMDEQHRIAAACNKSFVDVTLIPTTSMVVENIYTKDNTAAILEIQQALINKRVQYSDWSMFLSLCCKSSAAHHLRDARGNIMSWKDCILSIYKYFNFQKSASQAEDELVNRQITDGENVTMFMLQLTEMANAKRSTNLFPILLRKLKLIMRQQFPTIKIPNFSDFSNYEDVVGYINEFLPEDQIYTNSNTQTTNLFALQNYQNKNRNIAKKILFYCTNCTCNKCRNINSYQNKKPGFCLNCSCTKCNNTKTKYYQNKRTNNGSLTNKKYNINEIQIANNNEENPYHEQNDSDYSRQFTTIEINEETDSDEEQDINNEILDSYIESYSDNTQNDAEPSVQVNSLQLNNTEINHFNDKQPNLIFDTGADANFIYQPILQTHQHKLHNLIITIIDTIHCTPILIKPAIGNTYIIDKIARVKIQTNNFHIEEKFFIIPEQRTNIIFGKPLLKLLKYQLQENHESIEINGTRVIIPTVNPLLNNQPHIRLIKQTEIKEQLRQQYPLVFAEATLNTKKTKHNYIAFVRLNNFPYHKPKAYFTNQLQRQAIQQFITQSLESHMISPIATDELVALSPVFPIQQSKDKIRIITDLRKVNNHLQYTPRPIPPIQHIFSNLANKTIFSSLDIRKAYQQIPIKGDKLGLITEFGSYKFNRLPYGLASAPYWWGEFIQNLLKQLPTSKNTTVSYYYDDLVIASLTIADHYSTLQNIMRLLSDHGLSLSYEKIHIAESKIHFLGYEISHNRLAIDKDKKNTIAQWELPQDKKAIEKFTGFVNFLRNFIPNASKLLQPFYQFATGKTPTQHINTTKSAMTTNFHLIKQAILKSITLKLFDPQAPTIIYTDASLTGAASILLQPENQNGNTILYPIAFYSIRFNPTQQRYSTVERELWAVLHTLEKARLLLSSNITIYTDNQGIISIGKTERATHPRLTKYLDLLNTYRLTWKYIKGSQNYVADYLSRYGLSQKTTLNLDEWEQLGTTIDLATTQLNNLTNEPSANDTDLIINNVHNLSWSQILEIQQILRENLPVPQIYQNIIHIFTWVNNNFYIFYHQQLHHILTDIDYIQKATSAHNRFHASHRVLEQIMVQEKYWNPKHSVLLLDIVRNCQHCETYQRFIDLPVELPKMKVTPPLTRWHFDFAGPLPSSNDYQYFILAVDYTSNITVTKPIKSPNSYAVTDIILQIYALFGKPHAIITDNAQSFISDLIQREVKRLHLNYYQSSVYNPRGNSKAERTIKMIKTVLKHLEPNLVNWPANLYNATNIVNNTKMIYGYAPCEIAFAKQAHIPKKQHSWLPLQESQSSISIDATSQFQQEEQVQIALFNHKLLHEARKITKDERTKIREMLHRVRKDKQNEMEFIVGDPVYRLRKKNKMHEPTWDGPFYISQQVGQHTYKIRTKNGIEKKYTYHSTKLRPAYSEQGSAIRTAAEYTRVYNDQERDYYIKTLDDIIKDKAYNSSTPRVL
ncbi:Tkp3 protein [Vanderwaltozyma polyspora DSM 70294]|uniref:RNA-directed DNA polymerase n=1 Tax=Vanderwaltozyma polyspora (strain ATCC 22028 / DSM 70294 / BCRC 21397 / CBS 2163 / NBRC 10782 / NRRL Y-8283 / UCD 57-17) TaxID=436907 RepID=A7THU1_VANPO|nr:Tkp3 protein [Vanderwaltozyma polyspora DSM 70294]EDO18103.1 Tkp3 protein [Vanderwaltozyma polyspora DSM 70294]